MSEARYTSDHAAIRRWVEERGGKPAAVKSTGRGGEAGVLRIDFPGYGADEDLDHIPWDEWFEKFDRSGLVMVLQDSTASGETSRFNKIVSRESADGRSRDA